MNNAIIGINFDEGKAGTYEAVTVSYGDKKRKIFNTGDVYVDWFNMNKWISTQKFDIQLCSSSWDHFLMDDEKISKRLKYFEYKNDKMVECKTEKENTLCFFIPPKMKTFQELKNYVKGKKK